jgi:MFS superfamily sulfate permease-like transporter
VWLSGFVIDFISFPVINGFTTSAAITIGFGQVKVSSTGDWLETQQTNWLDLIGWLFYSTCWA